MSAQGWLADTQKSYDTVAASYADLLRGMLEQDPYQVGVMALFADLVRTGGGGPVADVGCGTGRVTAHLHGLGMDVSGIDLSPGMIDIARRDHPGLRFEVGSMTDLRLADASLAGLIAWFSLIHIPDDEIDTVLKHFHRVLRAGGVLLAGFHVGDSDTLKTEGYGGHPMKVHVHRRPPERVAAWLRAAGFTVEAQMQHWPDENTHGAFLFVRRQP